MTDEAIQREVIAHLDALGASYDVVPVDPALADTTAFCEHYGYSLDESANCIVVASRDDPPVLAACLNLAHTKLDVNKRVRKLLGVRRLSFASAEQTRALTGMLLGGVTPFGLPEGLRLLVDARVMARDRVIVGGGSRSIKLHVDPEVFRRMADTEIVEELAVDA